MRVFLIRHPRPVIKPGICYGRLDVDCEEPAACAEKIKLLLPDDIPVFSSPLRRAYRLAELLASEVRTDERLREIDFGEWEGKLWDKIDRSELDAWAADTLYFTPPDGESVEALQARVRDFALSLDLPCVAIVTHAGVMRALLGHWQQLPFEDWAKIQFKFGELVFLETSSDNFPSIRT